MMGMSAKVHFPDHRCLRVASPGRSAPLLSVTTAMRTTSSNADTEEPILPLYHTALTSTDFHELLGLHHLSDTIVCRDIDKVTNTLRDIAQRVYDSDQVNLSPALMFVADFDYTLSMPGGLTSWSVIDSHPLTPAPVRQGCVDLAVKYYPVEVGIASLFPGELAAYLI